LTDKLLSSHNIQQKILEDVGVVFNDKGKCDLNIYRRFPEGFEKEDKQPILFK
jgi:hypothetical protein